MRRLQFQCNYNHYQSINSYLYRNIELSASWKYMYKSFMPFFRPFHDPVDVVDNCLVENYEPIDIFYRLAIWRWIIPFAYSDSILSSMPLVHRKLIFW